MSTADLTEKPHTVEMLVTEITQTVMSDSQNKHYSYILNVLS